MVSLDCNMVSASSASSSHITIRSTAAKTQLPIRKKILLLSTPNLKCCSQMDFKIMTSQWKGPPDKQKGPIG